MQFLRTTCALLIVMLVSFAAPASAQLRSFHLGDAVRILDGKGGSTKIIACHSADKSISLLTTTFYRGAVTVVTFRIWERDIVFGSQSDGSLVKMRMTTLDTDKCIAVFQDVPTTPKQ